MAAEKGFPDATVTSEIQNLGKSQVAVIFHIEEGPKARIQKVQFMGVKAFSERKLRNTLKKTREHWFLSWITRHDIYSESRYQEDEKILRELYESQGYLDVEIQDPIIESELAKNGKKKDITITIPIKEGISYNLGDVSVEGNKVIEENDLFKGFKFEREKPLIRLDLILSSKRWKRNMERRDTYMQQQLQFMIDTLIRKFLILLYPLLKREIFCK